MVAFGFAPSQADIQAILGDVHPRENLCRRCGVQKLPLLPCRWRPFLADTGSPRLGTKGPRQLFGLSLLIVNGRARRPSDFFAVFLMDQGRGRSVAPTWPILRPQTRYKGRGCQ